MRQKKFNLFIYLLSGSAIIGLVFLGYFLFLVDLPPKGMLRIIFLDVGQGDAILIQTPDQQNILIDGGPDKNIIYKLDKYIPFNHRQIDIMIATHADLDHITGLTETLARYSVKAVLDNGLQGSAPAYTRWQRLIKEKNIYQMTINAPQTIDLEDQVSLEFLWPNQELIKELEPDNNFASIVVKLIYGQHSFLLTGDATQKTEQELMRLYDYLEADVLKVGHHGSKYSSGLEFLQKIQPQYGIISVGEENKFGHPNLRVLKNLEKIDARILRTDKKGDIIFTSNGKELKIKN
ncbi:MBL fold metallo-hydrolase [Patescibacteria group bacterium]|nr:MBL fold metallo-hydrolase [Patescibacteria group bacterium]